MKFLSTLILSFSLLFSTAFAEEVAVEAASEPAKELSWYSLRVPEKDYTKEMQEVREKKLHAHKHLGMLTLGLAAASAVTAVLATNKMKDARSARGGRADKSDADEFNLHVMTAGLTMATYFTTAYFSLSAPKADTTGDTDGVRWHKYFASVHMPAMIIGPLLGLKAISDYKKGQDPSGIAKLHKPIMALGVAALAGAVISVEF